MLAEDLTHAVIGAFYTVHRTLGYGYREYIYALALERELIARGHRVAREVAVIVYQFYRVVCENRLKTHQTGNETREGTESA